MNRCFFLSLLLSHLAAFVYFEVPFASYQYAVTPVVVDGNAVHLVVYQLKQLVSEAEVEFDVKISDRLVAVDGIPISTLTFEEIADEKPGASFLVPLLETMEDEHHQLLHGFVKLQVLDPKEMLVKKAAQNDFVRIPAEECLGNAECTMKGSRNHHLLELMVTSVAPYTDTKLQIEMADRIVAIDGIPITLTPLDEILDAQDDFSSVALPLVDHRPTVRNILSGFLHFEFVHPKYLVFEPTTNERVQALSDLIRADEEVVLSNPTLNHLHQRRYFRDTALEATTIIPDKKESKNASSSYEIYDAQAEEEEIVDEFFEMNDSNTDEDKLSLSPTTLGLNQTTQERPQETSNQTIYNTWRKEGKQFEYSVTFNQSQRQRGLGIFWDAEQVDKMIVDSVDPYSPGGETEMIFPQDHLIRMGDNNVSALGMGVVIPLYKSLKSPLTLTFICPERIVPKTNESDELNATAVSAEPEVVVVHGYPLTPHSHINATRKIGKAFWYELEFPDDAPVGIYWDLAPATSTIVESIVPKSRAAALSFIQPGDQLVHMNDINVTEMAPRDVIALHRSLEPPRKLLMYVHEAQKIIPLASTEDDNSTETSISDTCEAEDLTSNWNLVPLKKVNQFRAAGTAVYYQIVLHTRRAAGIDWDAKLSNQTIVLSVNASGSVGQYGVVLPKDQLVALNEENVTGLGPHQALAKYSLLPLPRKLIFWSKPQQVNHSLPVNEEKAIALNYSLILQGPFMKNWAIPLTLAPWSSTSSVPLNQNLTIVVASSPTACSRLDRLPPPPVLVIVYRGVCSFPEKARRVQEAGGSGLLIVNNAASSAFPKSSIQIQPVDIAVVMLSKDIGEVLMAVVESQEKDQIAQWVETPSPPLESTPPVDFEKSNTLQGIVANKAGLHTITFGCAAPEHFKAMEPFQFVFSSPLRTACHRDDITVRGKGSVVTVKFGVCSIMDKVKVAKNLGAKVLILVSVDDEFVDVPLDAELWILTVNKSNGKWLEDALLSAERDLVPLFLRLKGS